MSRLKIATCTIRPRGWAAFTSARRSAPRWRRITELGLVDAFRHFEQPEKSFSWWDYRQGAFRRNNGLRIDLILVHRQLLPRLARLPHRRGAAARRAGLGPHPGNREFPGLNDAAALQ